MKIILMYVETFIFNVYLLYSVLFELVPTSAENIQFKSFRVANLS